MASCFAQEGFAQSNFIQGCPLGLSSTTSQLRIPRWLLKFERSGVITYLSDIGGEVEGQFYEPADIDVQISDFVLDLERMSAPILSATVTIPPSALHEFFLDIDDLGQAKVTISSWDGYTARPIIKADLSQAQWGYDGESTTFQLEENFRHNPGFPKYVVDFDAWARSTLAPGARFKVYPQTWGNAKEVPMFAVIDLGGGTFQYMIAGHGTIPVPGGTTLYADLKHRHYVGVQFTGTPTTNSWNFSNSQGIHNMADFLRVMLGYSETPDNEQDKAALNVLEIYLKQFTVGGYVDSSQPFWSLIASRFFTQYLFTMWQAAGLVTGCAIDPTAFPIRDLVLPNDLLQLQEPIEEETKFTSYKVRYAYQKKGSQGEGWYGVQELGGGNNPYLKTLQDRWGYRQFGNPIDVPLHANSIDLPDVHDKATAKNLITRYAKIFHRGQKAKYFQLAEFADILIGSKVRLYDEDRGYDGKEALLIGRRWITPQYIVQTYRTIEPFELVEKSVATSVIVGCPTYVASPVNVESFSCFDIGSGAVLDPTGGPSSQPAIIRTSFGGTGSSMLTQNCACGLNGGGYIRYGATGYFCIPVGEGGAPGWGYIFHLKIWADPTCSVLENTITDAALDSGAVWPDSNSRQRFMRQKRVALVASGKWVTLEVELVTTGTMSGMITDIHFEFSPTILSPTNEDPDIGTC